MARPLNFGHVIRQPAVGRHTATVFLLHGLGDTGDGWAPVGPTLNLPHVKFVYPTAPTMPITVNMGMRMPAWFDITHLDSAGLVQMMKGRPFDPEGTKASVDYIKGLVAEEVAAGIPHDRIVVGGFSQGGRIAYETVLTHSVPLAGCAAMSSWLEPSLSGVPEANLSRPFFVGHGSVDNLIPPAIATTTQEVLEGLGCTNVEFKMYTGMGHSTCPQELQALRAWLLRVVPNAPPTKVELESMSAKQLKAFVSSRGGSTYGLLEKPELLEAAFKLL